MLAVACLPATVHADDIFDAPGVPEHGSTKYEILLELAPRDVAHRETLLVSGSRSLVLTGGLRIPASRLSAGDSLVMERNETARVLAVTHHKEVRKPLGADFHLVVATVEHDVTSLVSLKSGIDTLETTPDHPFYIQGKGWAPAGTLAAGDKMLASSGQPVALLSAERHDVPLTRVHNLVIDGVHTYRVGKDGLLVHNGGACTNTPSTSKGIVGYFTGPDSTVGKSMALAGSAKRHLVDPVLTPVAGAAGAVGGVAGYVAKKVSDPILRRTYDRAAKLVVDPLKSFDTTARAERVEKLVVQKAELEAQHAELVQAHSQIGMDLADATLALRQGKSEGAPASIALSTMVDVGKMLFSNPAAKQQETLKVLQLRVAKQVLEDRNVDAVANLRKVRADIAATDAEMQKEVANEQYWKDMADYWSGVKARPIGPPPPPAAAK